MSNNEIVENNIELIKLCVSHQVRKYETPRELYDDIVQDVCLILLEYDNEKLNKICEDNRLNSFLTGILVHQLFSNNSQTYRTYRRLADNSDDISKAFNLDENYKARAKYAAKKEECDAPVSVEEYNVGPDDSDFMASVKESLDKLSIGELTVFLNFAETGNISKLARQMKVPQALLNHYIGNVKNKIKENILERDYD